MAAIFGQIFSPLLLENVGADRAVQLGDPEVWRAAVAKLPCQPLRTVAAAPSLPLIMAFENPCPAQAFVVFSDREKGRGEPVAIVDLGFILAVVAFGSGLSLATYRVVAGRLGWPMGTWHKQRPALPTLIGSLSTLLAAAYAVSRGYGGYVLSASAIPVFGLAWAAFWTGFLRVGAQSALLLAPLAAALLVVRWYTWLG
jgi:hypothetical protein